MQKSSAKANSSSASQEISRILPNPKIPRRIPGTCTYAESNQPCPGQQILFLTIRFTIFLPSMPGPFKHPLSIRFPHKTIYEQCACLLNEPLALPILCPLILSS